MTILTDNEMVAAENLYELVGEAVKDIEIPKEYKFVALTVRALWLVLMAADRDAGGVNKDMFRDVLARFNDMICDNAILEFEPKDALQIMDTSIRSITESRVLLLRVMRETAQEMAKDYDPNLEFQEKVESTLTRMMAARAESQNVQLDIFENVALLEYIQELIRLSSGKVKE